MIYDIRLSNKVGIRPLLYCPLVTANNTHTCAELHTDNQYRYSGNGS